MTRKYKPVGLGEPGCMMKRHGANCGLPYGHEGPHLYFCVCPSCPGYPYAASEIRHPCFDAHPELEQRPDAGAGGSVDIQQETTADKETLSAVEPGEEQDQ